MAKRAKLKDALDRHKGVDHKLEHRKRQQKKALKRKRVEQEDPDEDDDAADEALQGSDPEVKSGRKAKKSKQPVEEEGGASSAEEESDALPEDSEGWETAEEDVMHTALDLSGLQDSDTSDSDQEYEQQEIASKLNSSKRATNGHVSTTAETVNAEEDDDDVPLSDIESLASEDKEDFIPHQRLTINNINALTQAYKSIALPSSLPFSTTQAVTSEQPTVIADIDDDLKRESTFYKQSLDAVIQARALLKKEGVPFARPTDYFAEMVKTDEHMGKIKKKLVDDAAGKKAAADARRQRDLKKFGKQVQIAKLQERQKEKRTTLDQIKMLKRKRSGAAVGNEKEDDLFDVALEDAAETQRKDKAARRASGGPPNAKRQKKDEKYGYGGKKRFSKSNDATSSADTRSFSVKKMKGKPRPGKSKRAKVR